MLAAWTIEEYAEDREPREVVAAVGDRAKRSVGGGSGFLAALVLGLAGAAAQAGLQSAELVELAPKGIAGLVAVVLGWLPLEGILALTPVQYLGIALVVLGFGMLVSVRVDRQWMGHG